MGEWQKRERNVFFGHTKGRNIGDKEEGAPPAVSNWDFGSLWEMLINWRELREGF